MENLEKNLKELQVQLEDIKNEWAKEVAEISNRKNFDLYSSKTKKAFSKLADKYADIIEDNLNEQYVIEKKIAEIKEEERKKLYKD